MRTIIFVLLKLVEVSGAVVFYWLMGLLGKWFRGLDPDTVSLGGFHILNFLAGAWILLVGLCVVWLAIALITSVPEWLKQNWEWSESITKKIKKTN